MPSLLATIVLGASAAAALPQLRPDTSASHGKVARRSSDEHHYAPHPFRVRQTDPTAAAGTHKVIPVIVGGIQDTFVPNAVTANVGDVIQFQFSNGNHTVTQSAQETPCQPLALGIHSGHIPFEDGQTTVGTFNMPVTNSEPMFLYCATGPHCQFGQVMVVNALNVEQVVEYSKVATEQTENIDGDQVIGGTVGSIPLDTAAFTPAPVDDGTGPGGPPGGAAPGGAAPVEDVPAEGAPVGEIPADTMIMDPAMSTVPGAGETLAPLPGVGEVVPGVSTAPGAVESVATLPGLKDLVPATTTALGGLEDLAPTATSVPGVEDLVPGTTAAPEAGADIETPSGLEGLVPETTAAPVGGDAADGAPGPQGIVIVTIENEQTTMTSVSLDPQITVVPAGGLPQGVVVGA